MINNFIRERATESKTTHLLQHLGQRLGFCFFFGTELLQLSSTFSFPVGFIPAALDLCL